MGNILSSPPQAGVEGPPGPPGDMGIEGVPGSIGVPGIKGNIGPVGLMGPQGPMGIQGPIGKKGPTGEQGPIGLDGIQGPRGTIGPTGFRGPTGTQGPIGIQGNLGPKGGLGPPGVQGPGVPPSGQNLIFGWTNDNCYSGNSTAFSGGSVPLTYSSTGSKIYDKCAQLAVNNNSPIFALTTQTSGSGAQCLWAPTNSSSISVLQNFTGSTGNSSIMKNYVNTCTNPCGDGTYCGNTGTYNVFQITQTSPVTYMPLNSAYAYPKPTTQLGAQTVDNTNIIFNKNNLCLDTVSWDGTNVKQNNIDSSYGTNLCSNASTQQFNFTTGQIINMNSGKCLDGGDKWFWNNCSGNANQTNFSLQNTGKGTLIKRTDTGKCMDLGNSNANYTCDANNSNQWFSVPGILNPNCSGANGNYLFVSTDGKFPIPSVAPQAFILNTCQGVKSSDGNFILVMQSDGNLVIYNMTSKTATWASGSNTSKGPYTFAFAKNGNLIVYNGLGTIIWQSGKTFSNNDTGMLLLQPDGNLVVYIGTPTISGSSIVGRMLWYVKPRLPEGGSVSTIGIYTVHKFDGEGARYDFKVFTDLKKVYFCVVGGGGSGGGCQYGGGGGGGGVIFNSSTDGKPMIFGTYTAQVAARGGTSFISSTSDYVFGVTANGGTNGGSGRGTGGSSGSTAYNFNGNTGNISGNGGAGGTDASYRSRGGGGGGAGGGPNAQLGGNGKTWWLNNTTYGGGGGAGVYSDKDSPPSGGSGGGAKGGSVGNYSPDQASAPGGGGGGCPQSNATPGYFGIVFIAYAYLYLGQYWG